MIDLQQLYETQSVTMGGCRKEYDSRLTLLSEHEETLTPLTLRYVEVLWLNPGKQRYSLSENAIALEVISSYWSWRHHTCNLRGKSAIEASGHRE